MSESENRTENMSLDKIKGKEAILLPETIELEIPAKTEYIALVRLCISGIGDRIELTIDEIEDLKIAISEVCNNSIRHAYNEGSYHNSIKIRFLIYPKKMMVKINDYGHGFDTKFVKEYLKCKDDERTKGIGLGLFLMKTLMDGVEYSSNPGHGTEVSMVKDLWK